MGVHRELERLLNKSYGGGYFAECISVGVLLENPRDYELDSSKVVFSVTLGAKKENIPPRLEEFNFYIMDESNHIYNALIQPRPISDTDFLEENDSTHRTNGLIIADLQYEFLFQSLRLAFYYKPAQEINIIELSHN